MAKARKSASSKQIPRIITAVQDTPHFIRTQKTRVSNQKFPKVLSGIQGLDVITNGGLPKNRPTLLLGNTGCGKTIFAMEFIVNGIVMADEPGVFIAFEENT